MVLCGGPAAAERSLQNPAARRCCPEPPQRPALESLERLPARGRLTGFEAPRDASSLAVIRRIDSVRRRKPWPKADRIAISPLPPGTPMHGGGVENSIMNPPRKPPVWGLETRAT